MSPQFYRNSPLLQFDSTQNAQVKEQPAFQGPRWLHKTLAGRPVHKLLLHLILGFCPVEKRLWKLWACNNCSWVMFYMSSFTFTHSKPPDGDLHVSQQGCSPQAHHHPTQPRPAHANLLPPRHTHFLASLSLHLIRRHLCLLGFHSPAW